MVRPTPKWATAIPRAPNVTARRPFSPFLKSESTGPTITQKASQNPRKVITQECIGTTPSGVTVGVGPRAKRTPAKTKEMRSVGSESLTASLNLPSFQRKAMPGVIKSAIGRNAAAKTVSKYGAPTEIFVSKSASRNSGYSVPKKMTPVATRKRRLLAQRPPSRETCFQGTYSETLLARRAKRTNERPITTHKKIRIKSPRSESAAKA